MGVHIRIWHWSESHPIPRVVGHAAGETVRLALVQGFVPTTKPWVYSEWGGVGYSLRGKVEGYCGQDSSEPAVRPQSNLPRQRIGLDGGGGLRQRKQPRIALDSEVETLKTRKKPGKTRLSL